jgi:hypothetical protein
MAVNQGHPLKSGSLRFAFPVPQIGKTLQAIDIESARSVRRLNNAEAIGLESQNQVMYR